MYKFVIICKYCGFEEIRVVYNKKSLTDQECLKCKDKNLIYKDAGQKIDQYKDDPPFPEKSDADDSEGGDIGWPYFMGDF